MKRDRCNGIVLSYCSSLKKIILSMIMSFFLVWWLFAYTIPTEFPYWSDNQTWQEAIDFGVLIRDDAVNPTDGVSEQIQQAFGIDLEWEQRATNYVLEVINWLLAVIWLLALTVLIYAFYKMVFRSSDEEWLKEARKMAWIAILALFVIWLARIIVSQLFDIFFQVKVDIDV